jgi:ketosteroid isomerase-like protein
MKDFGLTIPPTAAISRLPSTVFSDIITLASGKDGSFAGLAHLDELRHRARDMFQLPPMQNQKTVLDELFQFTSSVDYCDNKAQVEVLRHHYLNGFSTDHTEAEVIKDYRDDAIIHKVVDDMPSTYRGRSGAVHAWNDLTAYLQGPCKFDLTHISVCRNHAQVNWKAERTQSHDHKTLIGTDSFTFDETNHIKMQTTVALSGGEA